MEKEFTLTLVTNELQYLANVLAERPFKEVATLLAKLNQQFAQQNIPPVKPTVQPGEQAKSEGE